MTFAERLRSIEKRMMSKSRSRAEVSLVLDRTCEGTLAEQLAERLRHGIANGESVLAGSLFVRADVLSFRAVYIVFVIFLLSGKRAGWYNGGTEKECRI